MGILFALLTCFLLGTANVLLKKSFRSFSPSIAFFIFSIISLLLWGSMGIFLGVDFNQAILGIFVGLLSAILGQAFYIYVLSKGEISITATILSTFSIYTILFSILFNKERPDTATLFLIAITILGTVIVSLPEKFNKKELRKVSLILWPVIAAIGVGASDTYAKYYINTTSSGSFLFYVALAQVVVAYIYLKIDKQPLNQLQVISKSFSDYKYSILGSLFISVATMFLFLAFNFTLASIVSPIAASAPVVTVFLALVFLKEKISLKNWVGLTLVLISVITIGFVNS